VKNALRQIRTDEAIRATKNISIWEEIKMVLIAIILSALFLGVIVYPAVVSENEEET
jgi:hypothetical protein